MDQQDVGRKVRGTHNNGKKQEGVLVVKNDKPFVLLAQGSLIPLGSFRALLFLT
jgi:hypothetical protein